MALADGDIDLNAFQTVSYFDSFIKEHDWDLAPIGTTLIAPMGIYSEKYEDVKNIPEGSTIAIPKEATNMGRALLLLEKGTTPTYSLTLLEVGGFLRART